MLGRKDILEEKLEKHALLRVDKAYLHIWSEKGLELYIKPPLYKVNVEDLALTERDRKIADLLLSGKKPDEIAEKLGVEKEVVAEVVEKLGDREKIREIMSSKGQEENLDDWQVEYWAARSDRGWVFLRYRCRKGDTMLNRLSLIPRIVLEPELVLRFWKALNLILLVALALLTGALLSPEFAERLFSLVSLKDVLWAGILVALIYLNIRLKMDEKVRFANMVYLSAETITQPVLIGDEPVVGTVLTVYLYQSDDIPPESTDVFLINTEALSSAVGASMIRQYLNVLKELFRMALIKNKLEEQLKAVRETLDEYQKAIKESFWLGYNEGLQTQKVRTKIIRAPSALPITDIIKAITVIGIVGAAAYAISAMTKSVYGTLILMFTFGLVAVLLIVMILKALLVRTEVQLVRTAEGI